MLLNGSQGGEPTRFPFTEAVSFMIDCADQAEVDYFWNAFVGNGGAESMCGWCKDRFGLSWQVVPKQIFSTVFGADQAGAGRAMQAMLGMKKLIVADLEKAYAG
jgi:predicted 3-demethylubiquinone-9 3-methyltransferase (glyoxalase superfamily)